MYGLPYTGIIAHKLLQERLELRNYTQSVSGNPSVSQYLWTILEIKYGGKEQVFYCSTAHGVQGMVDKDAVVLILQVAVLVILVDHQQRMGGARSRRR